MKRLAAGIILGIAIGAAATALASPSRIRLSQPRGQRRLERRRDNLQRRPARWESPRVRLPSRRRLPGKVRRHRERERGRNHAVRGIQPLPRQHPTEAVPVALDRSRRRSESDMERRDSPSLDGAYLKLSRAHEHLRAIHVIAGGTVFDYVGRAPGEYVHRARFKRQPETLKVHIPPPESGPDELSLALGDFIQNLRAALDYLVYELAPTGHRPPRKVDLLPGSPARLGTRLSGTRIGSKGSSLPVAAYANSTCATGQSFAACSLTADGTTQGPTPWQSLVRSRTRISISSCSKPSLDSSVNPLRLPRSRADPMAPRHTSSEMQHARWKLRQTSGGSWTS